MFATANPSERRIRCFNIRRLMHGASVLLLELNAVRLSNMKFSVAAVILSGAVSFASRDVKAADLEISIPIQLSHSQNMDPSTSPDGKKLVFISVVSGKEQFFTMDADGRNIVQLTRDDVNHEDPAWSPDGKKIAFVMITKERTSIAVMNADGSNVDVLTPKEHNTIHPN